MVLERFLQNLFWSPHPIHPQWSSFFILQGWGVGGKEFCRTWQLKANTSRIFKVKNFKNSWPKAIVPWGRAPQPRWSVWGSLWAVGVGVVGRQGRPLQPKGSPGRARWGEGRLVQTCALSHYTSTPLISRYLQLQFHIFLQKIRSHLKQCPREAVGQAMAPFVSITIFA